MICQICNQNFSDSGMSYHLRFNHHVDIKWYYDKYIKKDNEGFCEKCKKEADFINLSKGYHKLCSSCKNQSLKIICRICGQETNALGMPGHCKKHGLNTKEYYDKFCKEGVCKICGKPTKFGTITTGYNKTCSRKCQYEYQKSEEYLNIIFGTNLEKYGVKAAFNNEKAKETMIKKYGVTNPRYSKEIQDRMHKNQRNNNDGKLAWNTNKQKETMANKYGAENPMQVEGIRLKIEDTNLKKYGAANPWQSKEISDKIHNKQREENNGKLAFNTGKEQETKQQNNKLDKELGDADE